MNNRISVLNKLIARKLTIRQAVILLNLSERQVSRLKTKLLKFGVSGLIHGLTGKQSNNPGDKDLYKFAVDIVREQYKDFGPTLACEHLLTDHKIKVNREVLRKKLITAKIWKDKKRKNQIYRHRRIPKTSYGEMAQYDGSYEHWLEDRGDTGEICLLMAVDDATSNLQNLLFTSDEGTKCTMEFWKQYLLIHGKPLSVYLDNFSTYKSPKIQRDLDPYATTQFGRAMAELGITLIFANSPQAKGRVERRFGNLQDRLIKEMRLSEISSIFEANDYTQKIFIPWFNNRYGQVAKTTQDIHQLLTNYERENLDAIFSIQTIHIVNNDFTVKHGGLFYQLLKSKNVVIFRKDKIIVEDRLDGSRKIRKGDKYLDFKKLTERLKKITKPQTMLPRKRYRVSENHPYRKFLFGRHDRTQSRTF